MDTELDCNDGYYNDSHISAISSTLSLPQVPCMDMCMRIGGKWYPPSSYVSLCLLRSQATPQDRTTGEHHVLLYAHTVYMNIIV